MFLFYRHPIIHLDEEALCLTGADAPSGWAASLFSGHPAVGPVAGAALAALLE